MDELEQAKQRALEEGAPAVDAYLEYLARRKQQVVAEIEVTPVFTEQESILLVDLVEMMSKQLRADQALTLSSAATKISLGLKRARDGRR